MEGLIPFVYRAIVEYKNNGGGQMINGWYPHHQDSPSASYMRLPSGDSGRFQYLPPPPPADNTKLFGAVSNCSLSFSSSKTNRAADQVVISTGTQSPISRRVVNDRQMALIH